MRLTFLLFVAIYCALPAAFGQNLIALQHNGAATFFTTIPAAVTAAASGDTIYLPGGSFPGFSIDKKLAIIGVGHHPDSTAATGMTLISGGITMVNSDCDGSMFTGLWVNEGLVSSGTNDNVRVSRCLVIDLMNINNASGWSISECILFRIIYMNNSSISNNLITNYIGGASNVQIENNIFLFNDYYPVNGGTLTVKNNIFKKIIGTQSGTNSLFNDNIWASGDLPNGVFWNGNIGTGNIYDSNFDGLFTNFSYATYAGNIGNLYQFNFHLVNPAYNTGGTDGTPIGIYGGTFPWKDGSLPFNPHIQFKSIGNTTDPNGNLLINIQVKAQNH